MTYTPAPYAHDASGDGCEPRHFCEDAHRAAYRTPAERAASELVEALRDLELMATSHHWTKSGRPEVVFYEDLVTLRRARAVLCAAGETNERYQPPGDGHTT